MINGEYVSAGPGVDLRTWKLSTITNEKTMAKKLRITATLPPLHPGEVLREEFLDFCDHMNLDAIFEPVKG